jgi:hypothetical protein
LIKAQNGVLAAAGILERCSPEESDEGSSALGVHTTIDLGGSHSEYHKALDKENNIGSALAYADKVLEYVCVWWIDSLEVRFWINRIDEAIPFSQIVASRQWGPGSLFAGLPARFLSDIVAFQCSRALQGLQPLERSLSYMRTSRTTRSLVYRWKPVLKHL